MQGKEADEMTLRGKTVFIFGVCLLGLLVVSYVAISSIMMRGFLKHEKEDAVQNVERAREAIFDSLANLSSTVWDWANWDDLYQFAESADPAFVETNFADKTFVELKLNVVVVVDASHRILYGKSFDLVRGVAGPAPEGLEKSLGAEDCPLLSLPNLESSVTGLVNLPTGLLLATSRPILTSESKGPARGALIMGYCLDAAKIKYMGRETRLDFSLEPLPPEGGVQGLVAAGGLGFLGLENPIFTQSLNEETIAGYTLLEDVYGKPAAVLRVLLDRSIYRQGRATLRYLVFALMAIGFVYCGTTLLFIEKGVLARVIGIIRDVDDIGRSADTSERLVVAGRDELSTLAQAINGMLEALAATQDELRRANEELEARVLERTVELARANEFLRMENAERRRAEESLRKSEAKYRDLFMNAPVGVFQTSLEGRLLTANPALAHGLGYESPEQLMAEIDDVALQVHASPGQRDALIDEVNGSDSQFRFEGQYLRRDGSIIVAEVQGRVIRDGNGSIVCLEGFAQDVTERKRLGEVLRQARDNLELLVEQRTIELNLKTRRLEEANAALKALLRQRDEDRREFEEAILANVKNLIYPHLEKLRSTRLDKTQAVCVQMLESHMREITSPFVKSLSQPFLGLTPTEIHVADLLRLGKTTKEIADLLHLSESTILFHRNNLRSKLGLKGKKTNLRSYLQSLQ